MGLFGGSKQAADDGQQGDIIGFTKPKKFLFFKIKSKPIYENAKQKQGSALAQQPSPHPQKSSFADRMKNLIPKPKSAQARQMGGTTQSAMVMGRGSQAPAAGTQLPPGLARKPTQMEIYFATVAARHKELGPALRAQGIKESPTEFVRKMFMNAMVITVMMTIVMGIALYSYGVSVILALLFGVALFYAFFNKFIQYPIDRNAVVGKEIEKDILFATRDLVISMRSGMPLFNAITAVSTGYGAASQEFAKIVELVQLGAPIEQAIDDVSAASRSKTFKRVMLQTTVSLKAGADVVGALQEVVDEVAQERVIELRRYGQRLNALAMFYMLFGVIFPSMGIAVAAILTTFISIFTVNNSTLLLGAVFIFFLQLIFLNMMKSSRPTFAM